MSAAPGSLRAFAGEVWRMVPRWMGAALLLSLALSALEAAGVLVLVQLLAVVGLPVPEESAGRVGALVRDAFAAVGVQPTLAAVLAVFVAVMSLQALLQRAQTVAAWHVEQRVQLDLRARLYAAIAGARWLHFTRIRASDLLQALTTECDRCGYAASYLISVVTNLLVAAVYFALALRVSAGAALVAGACGVLLMLAVRGHSRLLRASGEGLSRAYAEVTSAASEHLQSMKVVKSYGAEERNVALFRRAAEHALEMRMQSARAYADSRALSTAGSMVLLALVTWVAVAVLGLPGTVAVLLAFLFFRLVPRLQNLLQMYQTVIHQLPAYENVARRIAELEAERERLSPSEGMHVLASDIRFEGVSFGYPGVPGDAVAELDLAIEARRTTALVGPSGSGKTTVADLVMGLVRPRAGAVVVDGRGLDESWLRGWREGIGYVAQETVLFHESVAANLRWAHPEATEDEMWAALAAAAAADFVRALPQGLETVIGDRGVRLSGGERQRLALARALLRRPALLILDEATSALDTENERRIRDAIAGLHGRVTILLITHRLSSVRDADAIHVMESGRLVESGSFAGLLARPGGRFRTLWGSQEAEETEVPGAQSAVRSPQS